MNTDIAARTTGLPASGAGAFRARVWAGTLMLRQGEPDELADAVLFLASSEAGYITGAAPPASLARRRSGDGRRPPHRATGPERERPVRSFPSASRPTPSRSRTRSRTPLPGCVGGPTNSALGPGS
ncbi:hypothetical protein [Streptomyces umbrinus]|uniref:hypothetical protein n=1 Tax=Streptomyces umbrinus TaxID=67370 RepID=UPI0033DB7B55